MARDKRLQRERNYAIKKRFNVISRQQPYWRPDAVLQTLAKEFYLSPTRIYTIVKTTEPGEN